MRSSIELDAKDAHSSVNHSSPSVSRLNIVFEDEDEVEEEMKHQNNPSPLNTLARDAPNHIISNRDEKKDVDISQDLRHPFPSESEAELNERMALITSINRLRKDFIGHVGWSSDYDISLPKLRSLHDTLHMKANLLTRMPSLSHSASIAPRQLKSDSSSASSSSSSKHHVLDERIWRTLPSDMLLVISGFLDAQSLCRLSCVDQFSYKVATNKKLWQQLIASPQVQFKYFFSTSSLLRFRWYQIDPKDFYAGCSHMLRKSQARAVIDYNLENERLDQHRRGLICHWIYDCFFWVLVPLCCFIFLLQLTQQLQYQDEHDGGKKISYFIFWPVYLLVVFMSVGVCLLCKSKWVDSANDENGDVMSDSSHVLPAEFYSNNNSLIKFLMELLRLSGTSDMNLTLSYVLLMVWLLLLSLRISRMITLSYWLVSIPFFISVGFYLLSPIFWMVFGCVAHSERRWTAVANYAFFPLAPGVAFVVHLIWRIEVDTSYNLYYVFTPLFVLDLYFLMKLLLLFCERMRAITPFNDVQQVLLYIPQRISCDGMRPLVVLAVVMFIFIPVVLFQLLIIWKMDAVIMGSVNWTHVSYWVIFSPLLWVNLIWLVLSIYIAIETKRHPIQDRRWGMRPERPKLPQPW